MAEQEILTVKENVVNSDPCLQKDSPEGRIPSSVDLVQAVVADQGFISKLSSALMAQMAPCLLSTDTAVLQGQADVNIPQESEDQRGSNNTTVIPGVFYDQTGANEPTNPAVTDDQSGIVSKHVRSPGIVHVVNDDCPVPAMVATVAPTLILKS